MSNNLIPLRSLGQNFLTDKNIINKIITRTEVDISDTVIEIGPGKGILTFELAKIAKKVIAIEKDRGLFNLLGKEIQEKQVRNIDLIHTDALKFNYHDIIPPHRGIVISNPPYDIASRLIIDLLSKFHDVNKIVFVVQKEVAQKAIATSGNMLLFSVLIQTFGDPKILFNIPRSCFYPQPRVDSSVLQITRNTEFFDNATKSDIQKFIKIVKSGFSSKRKFLINNLSEKLDISKDDLKKIFLKTGLHEKVRAENLTIKQWIGIYNNIYAKQGN